MATIDFPAAIPAAMDGNYSEDALSPWVDDAGEVGISRRRQRFTRELERFTYTIDATEAEKDAVNAFYKTTTTFGTAVFNWTHPTTSVVYEVRFVSRPSIRHLTTTNWLIGIALQEY